MHPLLLKMFMSPVQKLLSAVVPSNPVKQRGGDFISAFREARVRLAKAGEENAPSSLSSLSGSKETPRIRENRMKGKETEGSIVQIQELKPLTVLLQECGVQRERIKAFFDSLSAAYPGAGVPLRDLVERVHRLIAPQTGEDGRLQLEPGSLLRVESALSQGGLSPKEADQALSLSTAKDRKVDIERFIRLTALQRGGEKSSPPETREGEKPGEDQRFSSSEHSRQMTEGREAPVHPQGENKISGSPQGQETGSKRSSGEGQITAHEQRGAKAQSTHAPAAQSGVKAEGFALQGVMKALDSHAEPAAPAAALHHPKEMKTGPAKEGVFSSSGEKPAAKQDSESMVFHRAEPAAKPNSLLSRMDRANETGAETQPDRGRELGGAEGSRRAIKEASIEDGTVPMSSKGSVSTAPAPQQGHVKPAGTVAQPFAFSEDLLPAHVLTQVSKQLSRALAGGERMIRFRLQPPELGSLRVQLEWSQDTLKIEMVTDRQPVKEVLLASLAELKQALGEQGYRVDKVDVHVGESFIHDLAHSERDQRDPWRAGTGAGEDPSLPYEENRGIEPSPPFVPIEGRLLDLVA